MLKDNYDPESEENGKPPKFFHLRHFLNFLWNFSSFKPWYTPLSKLCSIYIK